MEPTWYNRFCSESFRGEATCSRNSYVSILLFQNCVPLCYSRSFQPPCIVIWHAQSCVLHNSSCYVCIPYSRERGPTVQCPPILARFLLRSKVLYRMLALRLFSRKIHCRVSWTSKVLLLSKQAWHWPQRLLLYNDLVYQKGSDKLACGKCRSSACYGS